MYRSQKTLSTMPILVKPTDPSTSEASVTSRNTGLPEEKGGGRRGGGAGRGGGEGVSSRIWDHVKNKHMGEGSEEPFKDFDFYLTGTFDKPLYRQVDEMRRIDRAEGVGRASIVVGRKTKELRVEKVTLNRKEERYNLGSGRRVRASFGPPAYQGSRMFQQQGQDKQQLPEQELHGERQEQAGRPGLLDPPSSAGARARAAAPSCRTPGPGRLDLPPPTADNGADSGLPASGAGHQQQQPEAEQRRVISFNRK